MMDKKRYAILELDIDSTKLGYFDDKKDILENSDFYWFPARNDMSDEQYVEYTFTLNDLVQNYEYVLVCNRRVVMKYEGDIFHPEVVSSRAILGDVRYGVKNTKIIINPYYERYVAQPQGENGPTYIAENGKVEVIMPTFSEDDE